VTLKSWDRYLCLNLLQHERNTIFSRRNSLLIPACDERITDDSHAA